MPQSVKIDDEAVYASIVRQFEDLLDSLSEDDEKRLNPVPFLDGAQLIEITPREFLRNLKDRTDMAVSIVNRVASRLGLSGEPEQGTPSC